MKPNFDQRPSLLHDAQLSRALTSLPARTRPAGLTTSLRVLASQQAQRARRRRLSMGFSAALAVWVDRVRFWCDDLMRPLALPFAGGVLSAVGLFSIWLLPTYPLHTNDLVLSPAVQGIP